MTETDNEQVILVDELDRAVGSAGKHKAHEQALRHRAFSIFVFHRNGSQLELLLQQRHPDKYHSGGLWTNTCCSHPRPGEKVIAAGRRRLKEEMGIEVSLHRAGVFHYVARFDNGLTENELVHVLVGFSDAMDIQPDRREAADFRRVGVEELHRDLRLNPEKYTPWLAEALEIAVSDCGS